MLRVLHLEDSEADRELICAAMNGQGIEHESHWVATKALFVTILDKLPVDVVLCDSGGPRFDGKEALALVRSRQPRAVFIFVTGHHDGPVFDGLKRSGADGVVAKANLPSVGEAIACALEARGRDSGTERTGVAG
jgi:CheY-like chemotaxis protein